MNIKKQIAVIDEISDKIKAKREDIKKIRLTKKKNRHLLENLLTILRRELDTSINQTIITPGGLWIDYDDDYKLGKVKKYRHDLVAEPFAKKYLKPNKEALQRDMNEDFKIITDQGHIATIEYTKFKEEKDADKPKDGKPQSGGSYKFDSFDEVGDWLDYAKDGDGLFLQFSSRAVEGDVSEIKFFGPRERYKEKSPRWTNIWGTKNSEERPHKGKVLYYTADEFASVYQAHDPGAENVKKNYTKKGPYTYVIGHERHRTTYYQKVTEVTIGKYSYWFNYMVVERRLTVGDWKREAKHWKWQYVFPQDAIYNESGAMGYGLMLIEVWRGDQLINRYQKKKN
jgi:hypothetical protein